MIKNLTLKQKDKVARQIYKKYKKAQLDYLFFQQHYNYYPQVNTFEVKESATQYQGDRTFLTQIVKKQELEIFIQMVDSIHEQLSKSCFEFIEHEYLNAYDNLWWVHYYSRASYYRMKHKVLDEFLEYALLMFDEDEIRKMIL